LAPGGKPRHRKTGGAGRYYLATGLFVLAVGAVACYAYVLPHTSPGTKPIILYVNQGNGAVNKTNFGAMASYANSSGFNTVFLQSTGGGFSYSITYSISRTSRPSSLGLI
jgi:hypothetical protein